MATAVPSADESVFDAMTEQIIAAFDRIMREVISRRDQLILEVEEKRKYFELKNSAMLENVRELEEMRSHLEKMSLKQNLATKKKDESLVEIDSEIDELKIDMLSYNQLKYSCSLDQLIGQVKQFGEIIDEASNLYKYSKKLSAVKIVKDFEGQNFASKISFHLDSNRQLLYMSLWQHENILIFNANDLRFVRQFGVAKLCPLCIATSKEFVYVGYSSYQLFQFKLSDYSVFAKIQVTNTAQGYFHLAVSSENQFFVLHPNGCLSICDRVLNLKEKVALKLDKFEKGSCQRMILIEDRFYILYNQCILTVVLGDWDNIRYLFKTENGKIPNIRNPYAFCIDQAGNIIVADSATNSIKFLSPEGELIHTIGEETVGSDNIQNCSDIAVYKNNLFVACTDYIGGSMTKQIRLY